MYETVLAKFPHLSEEDRLNIAQFTLDYTQKEVDVLFTRVSEIFL